MQTTQLKPERFVSKPEARRFGYALAIGINIVMVWIVFNVAEWGWPPFITQEWNQVSGIVGLSIIATIITYVAYLVYDPVWFKGLGDAAAAVVSLVASLRVLSVFPFDFSAYGEPWETLTRFILIVAIVGTSVAILVNLGKAASGTR